MQGQSLNHLALVLRRWLHSCVSVFDPRNRRRENPSLDPIHDGMAAGGLSWRDFEKLVTCGFQHQGFHSTDKPSPPADANVDWNLTRGSHRYLIRCRHWRAMRVTVRAVRDLTRSMTRDGMSGGFLLTSGTCDQRAYALAAKSGIELIDGGNLGALLEAGRSRVAELIFEGVAANGPEATPYCPACKTPMVLRTAKRGSIGGSVFWVCAQFSCRQTMVMGSERRRSA